MRAAIWPAQLAAITATASIATRNTRSLNVSNAMTDAPPRSAVPGCRGATRSADKVRSAVNPAASPETRNHGIDEAHQLRAEATAARATLTPIVRLCVAPAMAAIVPREQVAPIVTAMAELTMSTVAQSERRLLCALLRERGPSAPTLCAGWTTRDLAAHLFVREREPLAAGGLVLPPLKPVLQSRMTAAAAKPWEELVAALEQGPPAPMRWIDGSANLVEFVVHREDVRRAGAHSHSETAEDRDEPTLVLIWQRLRSAAPLMFRAMPVTLLWPGHGQIDTRPRQAHRVILSGSPVDLLLVATGRTAPVDVSGDSAAVASFNSQKRGF